MLIVQDKCKSLDIPCHIIGDAKSPRVALNATVEDVEVALKINSDELANV